MATNAKFDKQRAKFVKFDYNVFWPKLPKSRKFVVWASCKFYCFLFLASCKSNNILTGRNGPTTNTLFFYVRLKRCRMVEGFLCYVLFTYIWHLFWTKLRKICLHHQNQEIQDLGILQLLFRLSGSGWPYNKSRKFFSYQYAKITKRILAVCPNGRETTPDWKLGWAEKLRKSQKIHKNLKHFFQISWKWF